MKSTNISIRNSVVNGDNYDINLYFEIAGNASYLRIGDIVTDSSSNKYTILSFNDSSTSLFTDGELVTVSGTILPTSSDEYNSTIETSDAADLSPDVAWEAMISNVETTIPAYYYNVTIGNIVTSDNGSGTADVDDLLIDGNGNVFIITTAIADNIIVVRELKEEGIAPGNNLRCFISRPKPEGSLLPQTLLERLETPVVRDKILNLNSIYIWNNRGVKVNDDIENVTNITFTGATITEAGDAWNGGKSIEVTIESTGEGVQGPQGATGADGEEFVGSQGVQGPQGVQGSTVLEDGQVFAAVYNADIDNVVSSIVVYTNREIWATGTSYDKGDYVYAINTDGKYSSYFVVNATYPYVSTIEPRTDTDHWIEMSVGLNENVITFTNSDLNVGVYTISNLTNRVKPTIISDSGIVKEPDEISFEENNSLYNCLIDLSSQGTLSGTWSVIYLK